MPMERAMTTPRFAAAALISVLAAAPSFADIPQTPIIMGPAVSGQCVVGSDGCGLAKGASMDPVGEAAIVGLGQRAVPTIGIDAAAKLAEKKAAAPAAKAPDPADAADLTDLVAIGGQIINPGAAAAAPFRSATGMNLGASAAAAEGASMRPKQATFDTHVDGSGINTAPQVGKISGLSYTQSQKVETTLKGKGSAFDADPKLSAGDADFGAGGTRASSNGR
jgi:hypothetical protein